MGRALTSQDFIGGLEQNEPNPSSPAKSHRVSGTIKKNKMKSLDLKCTQAVVDVGTSSVAVRCAQHLQWQPSGPFSV